MRTNQNQRKKFFRPSKSNTHRRISIIFVIIIVMFTTPSSNDHNDDHYHLLIILFSIILIWWGQGWIFPKMLLREIKNYQGNSNNKKNDDITSNGDNDDRLSPFGYYFRIKLGLYLLLYTVSTFYLAQQLHIELELLKLRIKPAERSLLDSMIINSPTSLVSRRTRHTMPRRNPFSRPPSRTTRSAAYVDSTTETTAVFEL